MTLSIVIANFNHGPLLPEAIESILNQKRQPDEILIIDDCSTDNSLDVIEMLSKKISLIRIIKNKENLGVVKTFNIGFEEAKGKYVMTLASDDLLLPNFILIALAQLKNNPEIGICAGKIDQFSGLRPPYQFNTIDMGIKDELQIITPKKLRELFKKSVFFIYSNGIIFRRDLVLKYGKYQEGIANLCDWYLNNQVALNHGLIYVPQVFSGLRMSEESYSGQIKKDRKYREDAYSNLMKKIEEGDIGFRKAIKESGALGQLGVRMIEYLFKHPKYWGYFPRAALSKSRFLRAKLQR